MREVQSSDAAAQFEELLDKVERGEIVTIIRRGRTVARIVPEPPHPPKRTREEITAALERIVALRKRMPHMTVEELLSARDEGRK